MDEWILRASTPAQESEYIANGYLGTAVAWDGGVLVDSSAAPCFVRGLYHRGVDGIDCLAQIPCWNWLRYSAPGRISGYERCLDLRHGTLHTRLTLEEERGRVRLEQIVFAARHDANRAAVSLSICPEFDGEIVLLTGLEVTSQQALDITDVRRDEHSLSLWGKTQSYGVQFRETLRFEGDGWRHTSGAGELGLSGVLRHDGRKGEEISIRQIVTVEIAETAPSTLKTQTESSPGYEGMLQAHKAAWERLWQTDIEVDGDSETQRFLRAGLFYLWSSVREGDSWSIAPMGLSSNGYNGHIFWDAELWMYPSLLVTQPDLARSCTAYRERTIGKARERAAAAGLRGAQFPWEAAYTGEEMTPTWAETRDFQLHITADVAIGQWWYYLNSQDQRWLRDHGFPVIKGCADFWVGRVEYNVDGDRYEISNVVCADEYAEHVNNDAFTNASVSIALHIAARAAEIIGVDVPKEWELIADKMYVPYDDVFRRHIEYDGYSGQITKQADVELLAYPLEFTNDPQQVARDLDYCRTVIDPDGPAMSFSVYSILSAQLGRAENAYDYFLRSYRPNTRPPFYAFSETPTNDEFFFCTGVGGALQALLYGFSGLRLREDYFVLGSVLPPNWKALRLKNLYILGARTDIEIEGKTTLVSRTTPRGHVRLEVEVSSADVLAVTVTWDDDSMDTAKLQLRKPGDEVPASMDIRPNHRVVVEGNVEAGIRLRIDSQNGLSLIDVLYRVPTHIPTSSSDVSFLAGKVEPGTS